MPDTRLGVLDLVPISEGSNAGEALQRSVDLAQACERFGYHRYWLAEHHLNPGVAGTSPALVIALLAARTSAIRLGSAAVQLGHRTPLSVIEEFGLLDAMFPGRIDLGVGRSAGRRPPRAGPKSPRPELPPTEGWTANGLRIPKRYSPERLATSPRAVMQRELLQQPDAITPDYDRAIDDLLALLKGTYRSADGVEAHVVPGEGARVQLWVVGSSGGRSAQVAGERALRFAVSYHITPATALEAAEAYRVAFVPSDEFPRPYVCASADVVVADDEGTARRLAAGYGLWVRSIRSGEGAIPFPSSETALAYQWTESERDLVVDRLETQFVGTAAQVADQLGRLQEAAGADELVVTTITHDHAARVRSYQLLAEEWARR